VTEATDRFRSWPQADELYRKANEQFLGLARAVTEQLAGREAPSEDPMAAAQRFAASLEHWFTQSGSAGTAAFGPGLQMPSLGVTREQQELWAQVLELTQRFQALQSMLSAKWTDIGRQAAQQFSAKLSAAKVPSTDFTGLKSLYDAWIDEAEKAYSAQAHQQAFAQVLGDLTNTVNELKSKQRELVETWAQQFDLPTRSELDTVHLRMKEMQRELRDLQEALGAQRATTPRRAKPKPAPP
jgi:class III poly(R)-hydroxyalkanoic acid synthase PhaE subunit